MRARLKRADGEARLLIHKRCKKLIESMTMYHYPADKIESMVPVKDGYDHAADAMRYMVVNLDRGEWSVQRRAY